VEELSMRAIERLTGQAVERVLLPGFGGMQPSGNGSGARRTASAGRGQLGRRSFRPRRGR
jgi:hypothetical protein